MEEKKFENFKVIKLNEGDDREKLLRGTLSSMDGDGLVPVGLPLFTDSLTNEIYIFYKKKDTSQPTMEDIAKSRAQIKIEPETNPKPLTGGIPQFFKDYIYFIIPGILLIIWYLYNNGYI